MTTRALCLSIAAGLPLPALAQLSCNRPVGPDIVIAQITTPANFASASGRDAYSLGTIQANVGNAPIPYLASAPSHPLMASGLFRYSNPGNASRFEQIGQGWLVNGVCALQANAVCGTCPGGGCEVLNAGCSTSDTASFNGSQNNLSPRWLVNPHTGSSPFPFLAAPVTSSVSRRLQAPHAEFLFGAQYLVEVLAVDPADAAADNQNNNASHRPCNITFGGTEFAMALIGATTPEQPAIAAWKIADPTVTETRIQVPGDGLVILSSKATFLGSFWHYEYALYNMNADAGIGVFSVPLPAAAFVASTGFHDVDYTDGDGVSSITRDGTDWPAARAGDTIFWATTPFAQDPNANALLWGTLYNFRFTSTQPPVAGNASITLWKTPGVSIDIAAQVPSPAVPCYANCDGSTTEPLLNVQDFSCFLNAFASGEPYANCDQSTSPPVLNVLDFGCFLNAFAAGCS
jgi:hypothetical protein